jgi:putative flippase GtrA
MFIGTFTFAIDYLLYLQFLAFDINFNIAKFASSSIAVVLSYYLNSTYNFGRNNSMSSHGVILYSIIYTVLILFHVVVNNLFVSLYSNIHIAVVLSMGISFVVNFLVVNFYFKRMGEKCC